ncbi:amino acid/amide ABC transportersubstrate-binding protein HAAT family [Striga asiatica]|uniref:Amino acid/amide ABC transportersubstrate-binding protein HAAT family n=1 Tax=Striga asiatica TaxID=4170 RepID=A0A5A7RH32_STRAF|nr:amino acid/amide ABC transportersubstrate-binding protein HAAT family [Striga asiatica]
MHAFGERFRTFDCTGPKSAALPVGHAAVELPHLSPRKPADLPHFPGAAAPLSHSQAAIPREEESAALLCITPIDQISGESRQFRRGRAKQFAGPFVAAEISDHPTDRATGHRSDRRPAFVIETRATRFQASPHGGDPSSDDRGKLFTSHVRRPEIDDQEQPFLGKQQRLRDHRG